MYKQLITQILIILCCTSTAFAQNSSEYSGNYKVQTIDGHKTLTKWTGKEVMIDMTKDPELQKIEVLAEEVFKGNMNLEKIVLPEGLKVIGVAAFHECKNLVSIVFPQSLKTILSTAFASCVELDFQSLPSS